MIALAPDAKRARSGAGGGRTCCLRLLLTQSEIRFGVARDRHRLGLVLGTFMPSSNRVTAVRNVLNLVLARLVAGGVVGRGHDDDVCRHLRVNVAEKWGCSRTIKLEGPLLSLWPSSQVVPKFLVAADRSPKDVVRDLVAVKKFDGCTLLNDCQMRLEHQAFLIDDGTLRWSREG